MPTTYRIVFAPAAVLAGLLALAGCRRENAYAPPPPPEVQVAQPVHRMVTPTLEVTGTTAAFNQVDLVARVQGFLQEIDYVDGAAVKKGETLFVVEPLPYQAKLQQAQAGLAGAKAQLLNSEAEFARQQTLLRQQVTAQNTYDQALAKRDADRATVPTRTPG